jgi:carboxypeptidase family protein
MTTFTKSLSLAAGFCLLASSLASAQTLAGTVRDTSGAALPGATVEASSPALIERSRTATADGSGLYQITNLPPGTYRVTFSLAGFATLVREQVELSGGGVTAISAELRVGNVSESVTVSGETPVVDVQSPRQQTVLSGDVVRALPAARGYGNYLAALPAIQATGFNSGLATNTNFFTARGGRANEGAVQIDGLNVGSPFNGGGVSNYAYDMNNSIEVQVSISGGLGEADRGAPTFNIIPMTGGNNFAGNVFGSWAGQWGQSSNIDGELSALGFTESPALVKNWDSNFSIGGPIKRDRLWFFANTRTTGNYQDTQNQYANKNVGDPAAWTWARDENVRVRNNASRWLNAIRLTDQVTPRNKAGFYFDYTMNCSGSAVVKDSSECRSPGEGWTASGPGIGPGVATTSPESGTIWNAPLSILQGTWTSPISNRLLFESGYSEFRVRWGDVQPDGAITDLIPVTEQSTNAGVPFANYLYRGWLAHPSQNQKHATWRATLSYVSGSNNLKFGHQGGFMVAKTTTQVAQQLSYTFNNGAPIQLSTRVGPTRVSDRIRYGAFFVQDSWTRARLTLQGAVRFEMASSWSPDGENGVLEAHLFGPANIFPRTDGVKGYRDLTPRGGAVYDLFGNGKTALRMNVGQYLQAVFSGDAYTISNPATTLVSSITRQWTDGSTLPAGTPGRGDKIAQCDFLNPAANLECGPWSNLNWGASVATTRVNPAVLEGWGVRNSDWQFGVGIQHEIVPRVSVDVSYNRRWWNNFFTTNNAALTAADWDQVSLTAPLHSQLPGGGGYPVSFLVRNARQAVGVSDPYFTTNDDFGDETHYWHGVDVSFSTRLAQVLFIQAGTSTGRGVNDTCEIETARFGRPQVIIDGQPTCEFTEPWLTQARAIVSYTVPKVDVLVSTIVRSQPNAQPAPTTVATNGGSRVATYQMTPAQFLAATGVPLRAGLAQQSVNLAAPGAVWGDRINVTDLRLAKVLRFGGRRLNVGFDLYNLFNANAPTAYETVFDVASGGARWMQPTAVLNPRAARFNAQLDF